MSLLVTGSIGIDTVESPYGRAQDVLGGSCVYFAFAAAVYAPVRLVAVVGDDFPQEFCQILRQAPIDLAGLEVRKGSKTFRWSARYLEDMNQRETLTVALNVLDERGPMVPAAFADSHTVFLANTHPTLQRGLLSQLTAPKIVVCDTMNLWIDNERESLQKTLKLVTGVIINDGEARQLTGHVSLLEAGEALLELGPRFVIIKKGEHGAVLVTSDGVTAIPAYPARRVFDPTGAGDSFAGGVLGYLNAAGRCDAATLRRAMVRGTVAASFAIEDFSLRRMLTVTREEIDQRVAEFVGMLRIE
jgi:sugar/nucleoside kinase (ribokinase family)